MRSLSRQQRPRRAYKRACASAAWESTAVSQLFEGQMSYVSVCMHCHHQTRSTQAFTVLSLPIPTQPTKCTIQVKRRAAGALSVPVSADVISHVLPLCLCLCLCCTGLSVTVLRADHPDWGGAAAVLSVRAEERNHNLYLSG